MSYDKETRFTNNTSHLTHLSHRIFPNHFCTHFPQINLWYMLQLPPECRHHLTIMLHKNLSPKDSTTRSIKKEKHPGNSGENFATGSTSIPTSKVLTTSSPSYISSRNMCVQAFCLQGVNPSRSAQSRNTSSSLERFFMGSDKPWHN